MFDWFDTVFTRYPINSNIVATGCTSCSRFPSYTGKDAGHLEQAHPTKAIARMQCHSTIFMIHSATIYHILRLGRETIFSHLAPFARVAPHSLFCKHDNLFLQNIRAKMHTRMPSVNRTDHAYTGDERAAHT